MKPDTLQTLFDSLIDKALQERRVTEENVEAFSRGMASAIPELSSEISTLLYKSLRKKSRSMLKERRRYLGNFEKLHYSLWKDGIDMLESYLVAAFELGENFNAHYRAAAAKEQDYVFECMTRLHARAVHVGFEVLCLLEAGFADGAHARWRTAHEVAVVASFISMHDQNVAKRYLEHEVVESYHAMKQYQVYAEQLKQEPLTDVEVKQLQELYEDRCRRYGESYGTTYGWAAEVLGKKRPTFADIEEASGLEHIRPYYRMASHNVHANPKGIMFRLGLSDGAKQLLAGPSNYGLVDPAHGVAISVLQATVPMLNLVTTIDAVVMGKVMAMYVDDIGEVFIKIHRFMQERNESQ